MLQILLFIILIIYIYRTLSIENYGVFSHRGTLYGIKNKTRNQYTLNELKHIYPYNYWNEPVLSTYDKDIMKYHSKRFDPKFL